MALSYSECRDEVRSLPAPRTAAAAWPAIVGPNHASPLSAPSPPKLPADPPKASVGRIARRRVVALSAKYLGSAAGPTGHRLGPDRELGSVCEPRQAPCRAAKAADASKVPCIASVVVVTYPKIDQLARSVVLPLRTGACRTDTLRIPTRHAYLLRELTRLVDRNAGQPNGGQRFTGTAVCWRIEVATKLEADQGPRGKTRHNDAHTSAGLNTLRKRNLGRGTANQWSARSLHEPDRFVLICR